VSGDVFLYTYRFWEWARAHSFSVVVAMKVDAKQTVSRLVGDQLVAEGYELAEVVLSQYKGTTTVRLFVYGEHGVTIDECARLSRMVGDVIDRTNLFDDGYNLEVSSPGLDRPLTKARDFRYRVGETVHIEFLDRKLKELRGEIISTADDRVELRIADEVITVDLADIRVAKIVF